MTRVSRPITEPRTCDSCGAPIFWVTWRSSGKNMPVDAQPHPAGGVVLTHSKATNKLIAEKFAPGHDLKRNRWVAHWKDGGCQTTKR